MSKTNLYQLYDLVNEQVIGPVITAPRDEGAIRIFKDILKNGSDPAFKEYPTDFSLIKLAVQDTTTGAIEAHLPCSVYSGTDYHAETQKAAAINAARAAAAPAANNAANATAALTLPLTDARLRDMSMAELMSCARCARHYTVHANERCENGDLFQPHPGAIQELQRRHNT